MSDRDLDLVVISAINTDMLFDARSIGARGIEETSEQVDRGRERFVDRPAWVQALTDFSTLAENNVDVTVEMACGGSGYNTMHAVARMAPELRLALVGVQAAVPEDLKRILPNTSWPTALEELRDLAVDRSAVWRDDGDGGLCLSVLDDEGDRSLITWAASTAGSVLARHEAEIRILLGRTRHVHLTSIGGEVAASLMLQLLLEAKHSATDLTISLDPGEYWAALHGRPATRLTDAIWGLLAVADMLFLNKEEFAGLTGSRRPTASAAAALFDRLKDPEPSFAPGPRDQSLFVVKSATEAVWFSATTDGLIEGHVPQLTLPPARIVDSTGAGDVFAAGVLVGMLSNRGRIASSVVLGNAASRRKIQQIGTAGYRSLDGLIREQDPHTGRRVFISHSFDDVHLASALVQLLANWGVPHELVFCTASPVTRPSVDARLDPEILRAIKDSCLFIPLASPSFVGSAYCQHEVGAAWALGISMFPVHLSGDFERIISMLRVRRIAESDERTTFAELHDVLVGLRLIDKDLRRTALEVMGPVEDFIRLAATLLPGTE